MCPGARLRDSESRHGSIAIAQQRTEPAGWDPALAAAVAAVRADDFEIGADRIDECLDLVVVARQAADQALPVLTELSSPPRVRGGGGGTGR